MGVNVAKSSSPGRQGQERGPFKLLTGVACMPTGGFSPSGDGAGCLSACLSVCLSGRQAAGGGDKTLPRSRTAVLSRLLVLGGRG